MNDIRWGTASGADFVRPGDQADSVSVGLKDGELAVASEDVAIYGSREELAKLGRRIVAEYSEKPAGPAVTFDQDAFRVWLDEDAHGDRSGTIREANTYLSTGYHRLDGQAGWLVESVLSDLHITADRTRHPSVGAPWQYGEGVGELRVWTIAAPEGGPDGHLVGQVMVDGTLLALGKLTAAQLVPDTYEMLPGYEAAQHALTALAERVNEVAAAYRPLHRPAGAFGQLDEDDVECALRTLREHADGTPDFSPRQMEVIELVRQCVRAADGMADDD